MRSVDTSHSLRAILFPWLIMCGAWLTLIYCTLSGNTALFDHAYLLRGSHLPWIIACLLFLCSWQLMVLAMMLPSCLSAFASLLPSGAWRAHWLGRQCLFYLGYTGVWTAFAALAFAGDTGLHWLVDHWYWLAQHAWLIQAILFSAAGAFQFLPWKARWIHQCRMYILCPGNACADPCANTPSFAFGLNYGRLCLYSCWPLMLVIVALNMKSLLVMALLAFVMLLEKELLSGSRLHYLIGSIFLLLAFITLFLPWVSLS